MICKGTKRRVARLAARSAAVGSGVMMSLTMWGLSLSGLSSAGAAVNAGALTVVQPDDGTPDSGQPLNSGGSATAFSLVAPAGAACLGDSANDSYRVQSYVVPSTVDPNSLTFDSAGPVPGTVGATFRQPLYDATTTGAFVDALTLENPGSPRPRPGGIINIPGFSFGVFEPGNLPAGTYNVGLACTLGPASATQLDRFWNVQLVVVADAEDEPAGITWSVAQGSTTTTTTGESTTSTTSTTDGTTSTTSTTDGTTSTTDATTSTTDGTTPSLLVASGGQPTGATVLGSVTTLPMTGGSPMSAVVWSTLLLVFGRMTVLLGRPVRVRPVV